MKLLFLIIIMSFGKEINTLIKQGLNNLVSITEEFIHPNTEHLFTNDLKKEHILPYKFTKQSYLSIDDRYDIGNYIYYKKLSNTNTAIWNNKKLNISHISYRGSKDIEDYLITDLEVFLNKVHQSERFKKALNITYQVRNKYGTNLEISGHSLGGTIATYITSCIGKHSWFHKATTFNPGTSPLTTKKNYQFCHKLTHLRRFGDIVCLANPIFGNSIIYHTDLDDLHSINGWNIPKKN